MKEKIVVRSDVEDLVMRGNLWKPFEVSLC